MVSTESMLRELVANAHDLIFCLDPDERFVYTNPAWRATLGYSEQELGNRRVVLRITDDGVGISPPGPSDGSGLHSMRYRANFIGAALGIRPAPEGGTVVTCAMR